MKEQITSSRLQARVVNLVEKASFQDAQGSLIAEELDEMEEHNRLMVWKTALAMESTIEHRAHWGGRRRQPTAYHSGHFWHKVFGPCPSQFHVAFTLCSHSSLRTLGH